MDLMDRHAPLTCLFVLPVAQATKQQTFKRVCHERRRRRESRAGAPPTSRDHFIDPTWSRRHSRSRASRIDALMRRSSPALHRPPPPPPPRRSSHARMKPHQHHEARSPPPARALPRAPAPTRRRVLIETIINHVRIIDRDPQGIPQKVSLKMT